MKNELFFPIVIAVLARVGREEILKKFGLRSCIASTRIITEVLARYGVASKPMAVRTIVTRSEDAITLGSVDGTIGKPPEWNGTLAGHLIVVVPTNSLLIDGTLDQVPTEQFDVSNLPCPMIAPVTQDFIAGRETAYFCLQGCGVIYEPHSPIPETVLATPEWNERRPRTEVVDRICSHIDRMKPVAEGKFKRRYPEAHDFCRRTNSQD